MDYIKELCACLKALPLDQIHELYRMICICSQSGNTVFIAGNGGSAASAEHWVCDLSKSCRTPAHKRVNIVSLCSGIPLLTAYANDISFEDIFAEQLRDRMRSGDVLIILSASGNSPNLIRAVDYSRKVGAKSAAIVGSLNGYVAQAVTLPIIVQSENYGIIEDVHMAVNHMIKEYFLSEKEL